MASENQSSSALSGFRGIVFFFAVVLFFLVLNFFLKHHKSQRHIRTARKRVCCRTRVRTHTQTHTDWRFGDDSSIQHGWGLFRSELTRRGHSEALAHS